MASLPGGGGLAFSFIVLSFFLSFSSSYQTFGAADQREFGYFVLSLLWPGTICQSTTYCCSSNACCKNSLSTTEFTIHGLWPNYNDDTWPACCSRSEFDIKKIKPLINTLNKYWPTLSCNSSSVCNGGKGLFWAHEWEKHGTCSYPVIKDEYSYFSTTLNLYFKYNVTKILIDAGYEPSNNETYPLGDIIATIKNAVGSLPLLVCSHGAVEELRICFFKDFKPRDCIIGSNTQDDMLGSRNSCPRYIRLPEYRPHNSLEDGNTTLKWPSA